MKIFFYMGRNPGTKSGVSWKIWKIECKGRKVTTYWGPAILVNRKPRPSRTLQSRTRHFTSEALAKGFVEGKIRNKLGKGYQRRTRWRN